MLHNIHKNLSYTPLDFYKNLQFIQSIAMKSKSTKTSQGFNRPKRKEKVFVDFERAKRRCSKKFQELFE